MSRAMTSDSTESLAIRRKRLRYLSWHRGMRETDLLLGSFADRAIATLSIATSSTDTKRMLAASDAAIS